MTSPSQCGRTGDGVAAAPLDRDAFLSAPIAHRGLHDAARGIVENTGPAFAAAIAGGFGIECDVRASRDGRAIVFHDATTDRLLARPGTIRDLTAQELRAMAYPASTASAMVLSLDDLLDLIAGRVPVFVEVKSDWRRPDPAFVADIAATLGGYAGRAAVMSFDPDLLAALATAAPRIPRGIVAARFADTDPLAAVVGGDRLAALARLAEAHRADPAFIAYQVEALPTPETTRARENDGLPILAWTVRTPEHWEKVRRFADAAIFEGEAPSAVAA